MQAAKPFLKLTESSSASKSSRVLGVPKKLPLGLGNPVLGLRLAVGRGSLIITISNLASSKIVKRSLFSITVGCVRFSFELQTFHN